jgi:hypothetical protein
MRRIRDCADIVFRDHNLPAGWSASASNRNIDELKLFLKYDINEKTYPDLPPICYPGLKKDPTKVFRVRIAAEVRNLPKEYRCLNFHTVCAGYSVWQGLRFDWDFTHKSEHCRD